jgi:hypothetical protein
MADPTVMEDKIALVRIDLSDTTAEILGDSDIERAYARAVSDLSRFYPLIKRYETVTTFAVTNEAWVSTGTVQLDNNLIEYKSEVVKNKDGIITIRDIDYTFDYANGTIANLTGLIGDDENNTISYNKSKVMVNIASLTDLIRVVDVECPSGQIPRSLMSFEQWGDVLELTGTGQQGRQQQLQEGNRMIITYEAQQVGPGDNEGSYPLFLSEIVHNLALYYCLVIEEFYFMGLASTELTNITDLMIAAGNNNTSVTDTLALIAAALSTADIAFGAAHDELSVASGRMTTGVSLINGVNWGNNVPENYGQYAHYHSEISGGYSTEGSGKLQEASLLLQKASSYLNINSIGLNQITQYQQNAQMYLSMSQSYRQEALERRNEAYAILNDKKQWQGNFATNNRK